MLIGLDNLPQAVFRRSITTIRIRVVLLHQGFVFLGDVFARCGRWQAEIVQRLFFQPFQLAGAATGRNALTVSGVA